MLLVIFTSLSNSKLTCFFGHVTPVGCSNELLSAIASHQEDDEAFYAYLDKVRDRKNRVFYPPLQSLEDLEKYPEFIEQMRQDYGNKLKQNDLS